MIRVVLYLVLVALLAVGVVWLAERPGEVAVTWLGWRIETSVMVTAVAIAILVAITMMVWSLVRFVLRSPELIKMVLSQRRGVRGYLALSRGLIAIGAGDARAARRATDEAERIAPGEPLALLLNAQCAQLAGDRATAESTFRSMAARDDTKLLGLRGLYVEAQRRKDAVAARGFAEEAAKAAPSLAWAGQAVLEFRCAAGDWAAALSALDRNSRYGLIDRTQYKRQRAVLITARAIAAEENDRDRARALALDAVKLAPTLVPAVDLAARLLGETGDLRRASRMIERAWQANPHPDLAEAYAHLRPGDSARERLGRVQSLALKAAGHIEGALAVARAALDAQEFTAARAALRPLMKEPTQRVAALMAEIEERESGDEGRAREWMARALRARRDPKWTADGIVSDRWMPVSPATGRLDAFEWKVPVAEIADEPDVIDGGEPRPAAAVKPAEPARAEKPPKSLAPPQSGSVPPEARMPGVALSVSRPATSQPARVEAVVPLVHAPDDPGPEPSPDQDPTPDAPNAARGLRRFT
jgi:HemY protein